MGAYMFIFVYNDSSTLHSSNPTPTDTPHSHSTQKVERADVLAQRMARGLLFHGFHEPPISFPPTFKRRVRAPPPPGHYADLAALQAAYLTRRGHDGAELVPPSYTDRILVRCCLYI